MSDIQSKRKIMKDTVIKLAAPAVLAFAALSVQAQTIETDYPGVQPAGPVLAAPAPAVAAAESFKAHGQDAPYLLQSNFDGPTVNPARLAKSESSLTSDDVRANAEVNV